LIVGGQTPQHGQQAGKFPFRQLARQLSYALQIDLLPSEIDTFEGVNLVTNNQMGLHTNPGCTVTGQQQSSTLLNSTDCSNLDNSNQGCITTDPNPASYGAAFAAAGGGVFVTEFATTGISCVNVLVL
jgi:hypothetical protein